MTKSDGGSEMDWLQAVLKARAEFGLYEDSDGWPDDFDHPALSLAVLGLDEDLVHEDDRFPK